VVQWLCHREEDGEGGDGARRLSRPIVARRGKRRPKLLAPATDLPVELRAQSLAQPPPHRWPLGDALCDQVAAGDLQPYRPPLGHVAIEPPGAQRPGERKLDPCAPAGALDSL